MPLPRIISSVAPSSAIGLQIAKPAACIGTEISETVAQRVRGLLDLGIDVPLGIGMSEALLDDADLQALGVAAEAVGQAKEYLDIARARGETARGTSEGIILSASARVALFRDFPSGFSA
jgi:hypothetical protein